MLNFLIFQAQQEQLQRTCCSPVPCYPFNYPLNRNKHEECNNITYNVSSQKFENVYRYKSEVMLPKNVGILPVKRLAVADLDYSNF